MHLPDALAGEVLRRLARDIAREARENGAMPSPAARTLLDELYTAAQRHTAGCTPKDITAAPIVLETAAEAARRMGCTPRWVRQLAAAGRIPARRVGRAWMVERSADEASTVEALPQTEVPPG